MAYAPAVLGSCLTGDWILVMVGAMVVVIVYIVADNTNTPSLYKYSRVLSLPIRVVYVAVLAARFQFASALALLGSLIAALAVLDLILGDGAELASVRLQCSYEVMHSLPHRVVICRRHGAAHLEDEFGPRGNVPECVTGIGTWERTYTLLAEMYGCLVELRPMDAWDWTSILRAYVRTHEPLPFVGLDIYSEERSSVDALRIREQREEHGPSKPPKLLEWSPEGHDERRKSVTKLG